MIETLKTKLKAKAEGTDKEFLLRLISEAENAKASLTKVNHPENASTDLADLKANLENIIIQSTVIIFTGKDGTCELEDEEIRQFIK